MIVRPISKSTVTADLIDEGGLRGAVRRRRGVVLRLPRSSGRRRGRHLTGVSGDPVGRQDPLQEVLPDHRTDGGDLR